MKMQFILQAWSRLRVVAEEITETVAYGYLGVRLVRALLLITRGVMQ